MIGICTPHGAVTVRSSIRKEHTHEPLAMLEKLYIITVYQPKPGYGHGRPSAGMHARCVPPAAPRRDTALPTVQNHLETFLALCHYDWEDERIAPHAERERRA